MTGSKIIADFSAGLRFEDIPEPVVDRLLELMLDWISSCLAGANSRQAMVFRDLAHQMGPAVGPSSVVGSDLSTSPLFAAMINGAASHVVEQDDLHNSSIFHPATVVFPPVLAMAEERPSCSGADLITAAVAGYETGIRVGEFLGRDHYKIFHTTATAGTIASAMAVSNLLNLDQSQTLNALGSAGTQAAGLWEFLGDAADSKQLHTAKASSDGLLAAVCAKAGLTGARKILEGPQGLGAGLRAQGDIAILASDLGERWALMETSFKFHASCRHTHPAADAMALLCSQHNLVPAEIKSVVVSVYQAAKDVLGAVVTPESIHQSKFSMGFVLALIACKGAAGVSEFTEAALQDPELFAFHHKVSMRVDPDIESVYPQQWCSRVEVEMNDGTRFSQYVDTPKGDPGNGLSRSDIEQKARKLVAYFKACEPEEINRLINLVWNLRSSQSIKALFAQ